MATTIQPPTSYVTGYERARKIDPALADAYIKNTLIGDPPADAAMASLAEFDQGARSRC